MWPLPTGFRLFDREAPMRGTATQSFIDLELGAMSPTGRAFFSDDDDASEARSTSTSVSWATRPGRLMPRSLVTDVLRDTTARVFGRPCRDMLAGPVTRRFYEDVAAARRDAHAQAHTAAGFRHRAHAVVAFACGYDWRGAHPELAQVQRALVAQRRMGHPDAFLPIEATRLVLGADGLGIVLQRSHAWRPPDDQLTGSMDLSTYEQLALAVGLVHAVDAHTAAWARALGQAAAQVRGMAEALTGTAPLGSDDMVLPLGDDAPYLWATPQMWAAPCVVGLGVGLGTGSLGSGVVAIGVAWVTEASGLAMAHRIRALGAWRTLCAIEGCEDEGYGSVADTSDVSNVSAPDDVRDAVRDACDLPSQHDLMADALRAWPPVERPLLRIYGAPS